MKRIDFTYLVKFDRSAGPDAVDSFKAKLADVPGVREVRLQSAGALHSSLAVTVEFASTDDGLRVQRRIMSILTRSRSFVTVLSQQYDLTALHS